MEYFFLSLDPRGPNFWNEVSKHLFPLSPVFSLCRFLLTELVHPKGGELFFLAGGGKVGLGSHDVFSPLCVFILSYFFLLSWETCAADKTQWRAGAALQSNFPRRKEQRARGTPASPAHVPLPLCPGERHLNTVWPAIVQPVSRSPPPPPATPVGYYCPLFQKKKKKKCSSGGEGSNEGQLSWRFDPKDSAGAKQKMGREKKKKKRRSRVLESRETFHHLVRHYTKQPHLPQRSRLLIPQCLIFLKLIQVIISRTVTSEAPVYLLRCF